EPAVRGLDLRVARAGLHAEGLVVVLELHRRRVSHPRRRQVIAYTRRLPPSPRTASMTIQPGDRLPEIPLQRIREGVETVDVHTLFEGKQVVLFAVPGAFTPTCSERHLPGFVEKFNDFRQRGV